MQMAIGVLAALSLWSGQASAQARGYLLYNDHCLECHSTSVHWRERRLATDWNSLQFQVRRWQGVAALNWNEEDIQNVTRYLNTRFYDFQAPSMVGAVVPVTVPASRARRPASSP
ncbi:cytochrome C [Variovorax sp. J22R133]|uniref:cytochrome C n=1 Tax=Variovorax brevis TaxID=3053503 RepID=UPI0025782E4E|nr:cytochrome C [Variovorax sp. J22R133]MDM0116380.1 cytochrome C [Variovorax sp. J22R133]